MVLKQLRDRIDRIDARMVELLNQRALEVIKISKIKKEKNLNAFTPEREASMLKRLKQINKGPFTSKDIENVFREILSICRSQRTVPSVAYFGPRTTFTHHAAIKKFGKSSEYIECKSIADVFSEVEHGRADYGVVPIENSTEGVVSHTLDVFIKSSLRICSEVYLPIKHNLLSKEKKLSDIKRVFSNRQAFAQCRNWLGANLSNASQIFTPSTAWSARRLVHPEDMELVLEPMKGDAAIADELAAEEYGLNIIARSIQDLRHNITRFLVLGKQDTKPTRHDKTSIAFSMKDEAGALHNALLPFKKGNINLTKIESRPSKEKAWKYFFFVDMEGHKDSSSVQKAIKALAKECLFVKILGSYPKES